MDKVRLIVSWISAHRKKVAIHFLILSSFLLYVLFLAGPLFEHFEPKTETAELYDISLPDKTNNIMIGMDRVFIGHNSIEPVGWAFVEGQSSVNSTTYIVLASEQHTYIYKATPLTRVDVTWTFRDLDLDLDLSGFIATISVEQIRNGEYDIGIYITEGAIEALQYTDKAVIKDGGNVELTFRTSKLVSIPLPEQSENITWGMDSFQEVMKRGETYKEITGWAFIKGQDSENSTIDIVLTSDRGTYIFDTAGVWRPDVTAYFEPLDLNLDSSGFIANIPLAEISNSVYSVGIRIKKDNIEALQYTGESIDWIK